MMKFWSVTLALLATCTLSANAGAGGGPIPFLSVGNLGCSIPGACDFHGGVTAQDKTFQEASPIALFGTVTQVNPGFGAVTTTFNEVIHNETNSAFAAYTVNLSSQFLATIAAFLDVDLQNGAEPLLTFASFTSNVDVGDCALSGPVTATCSGLNVMPQGAFNVAFVLSAPGSLTPGVPVGFSLEQTPTVAVPEPATLALLGIGLAGLAASRRRKTN